MPLNIGGGGAIKPFAKYNAKAGRWYIRGDDGLDREIEKPTFLLDLKNIRTGWLRFLEGQAPERIMDPDLSTPAKSPGEGWKRGFVVMAYSPKNFGGAVEMSSASSHFGASIREIYAEFEADAGKPENRGKVPVVACVAAEPTKDKYGTNYKPVLKIIRWEARPADLPDASPIDDGEVGQPAAATAAAHRPADRHVPPPAARAPAPSYDTDF